MYPEILDESKYAFSHVLDQGKQENGEPRLAVHYRSHLSVERLDIRQGPQLRI
jgi:hypothetical protein